jgi:hypothetical protein
MDLICEAMDQYTKEQQVIAKQVEATGQAVARFTLYMMSDSDTDNNSKRSRAGSRYNRPRPAQVGEDSARRPYAGVPRAVREGGHIPRSVLPKMQFPLFTGEHPKRETSVWITFTFPTLKRVCG